MPPAQDEPKIPGASRDHEPSGNGAVRGEAEHSAAFTPGPWLYRPRTPLDDWGMVRAGSADGWIVAMARDGQGLDDFSKHRADKTDPFEANGRLIAAAPDLASEGTFLLDRLDEFERSLTEDDAAREFYGHVSPAMARFRAAVAKAVGPQAPADGPTAQDGQLRDTPSNSQATGA